MRQIEMCAKCLGRGGGAAQESAVPLPLSHDGEVRCGPTQNEGACGAPKPSTPGVTERAAKTPDMRAPSP